MKPTDHNFLKVPCNKCIDCLQQRASNWAFRLVQEEQIHAVSAFVTLTYSDENIPISPGQKQTLLKKDLQLFFKRLRKQTDVKSIKYYACGEYGGVTQRPHYHMIIFDALEIDIIQNWSHGLIDYATVTPASIRYVTNYVCKPRLEPSLEDDREPEFSLMSKGLGKNYLTPQMVSYHKTTLKNYVTLQGGQKSALPRYLKDKIFDEDEKLLIKIQTTKFEPINEKNNIKTYGSISAYDHSMRSQASLNEDKLKSHSKTRKTI